MFLIFLCVCFSVNAVHQALQCLPNEELKDGYTNRITNSLLTFSCKKGYRLIGHYFVRCSKNQTVAQVPKCEDKDECTAYNTGYPCDINARCQNTIGSFTCKCRKGFFGTGLQCHRGIDRFKSEGTTCGEARKNITRGRRVKRVVGGQRTEPGDWPWSALITINEGAVPVLSGVLITPDTILTLASLLHDRNGTLLNHKSIHVYLGKNDRNKVEINEQQFKIKEGDIMIHPDFNREVLDNDLAILKLPVEAQLNEFVNPICLGKSRELRQMERDGRIATIAGWGISSTKKIFERLKDKRRFLSEVLKDGEMPVVHYRKCRSATAFYFHRKTMFCAGALQNDVGPCLGDGGAPLMVYNTELNKWFLIGLSSWWEGCGQPSKYSYFTRVPKYRKWISEITFNR